MTDQSPFRSLGIIPARWGSGRFPGKPLHRIGTKPLIQWTYENAKRCKDLDRLIVATDDPRIADFCTSLGAEVVMTSPDCETGSDRLAEVLNNDPSLQNYDAVINIQGDEPCLHPSVISQMITLLAGDSTASMATAATPFRDAADLQDPNRVKCVIDACNNALFFSRICPIHFQPDLAKGPLFYHMGIYAYRPEFLLRYGALAPTPLMLGERLEQMKVLEHGYRIKVAVVKEHSLGVDVPEDAKKVEVILCKQNISS